MLPDNYSQFLKRDREEYAAEKNRPACACCEEPIWGETAYRINGELWCPQCIENCIEYLED